MDITRPAPASSLSVTVEQLRTGDDVPSPDPTRPRRWVVEDLVDVAIDDEGVWDPDEAVPVPAVVVRMPAHVARHLASVLDDWTTIGRILESARGTDERDLAGVLHEAARAAETLDAERSRPAGLVPATGAVEPVPGPPEIRGLPSLPDG